MATPAQTFEQFAKSVMSRLLPLTLAQREEYNVLVNQGIDPTEARALVQSYVQKDAGFDESKHPRDHGKFSEGSGSAGEGSGRTGSLKMQVGLQQAAAQTKIAQAAQSKVPANKQQSLNEARQHEANAKAYEESHQAQQQIRAAAPPAQTASERHLSSAEQSLQRADMHLKRAEEEKKAGNNEAANAHTMLANSANAQAKQTLTKESREHLAAQAQGTGQQRGYDVARANKIREQIQSNRTTLDATQKLPPSAPRADAPARPAQESNGLKTSQVSQAHIETAGRSLERAERYHAKAAELASQGKAEEARANLRLAANANANARGSLTKATNNTQNANRAAEAKGEKGFKHDEAQHRQLEARHEELRGKIEAERAKTAEGKAEAATDHTARAEQALGQSRAAEAAGDKKLAESKMQEAKASVEQGKQTLANTPKAATGAEANKVLEAGVRQKIVESQTKKGVDKRPLHDAGQKLVRAKAHESASEKHAKAGNHERASHHATEAAHARHEAHSSLAKFGELLEAAADKSLEKSAGPKRQGKSEALTNAYLKAFYSSAEARLPKWQASHLKGRARRAVEKDKLKKDGLLVSDVHVPVPLGSRGRPAKAPKLPKPLPHIRLVKSDAAEMAYVNQALNLQDPSYREPQGNQDAEGHVGADDSIALEAHRLVQGMDMEMAQGAQDPEHARKTASRMLYDRPGYYDTVGATPEMLGDKGVMLDLGSGASRAMGHIGIDLHPYDYGTVLHDLDLGIPFPDGCARSVRMTHSLHPILDAYGQQRTPVPLLLEVQRVLREGGQLYYEGPEPLYEKGDPWPIPGLTLVSDTSNQDLTPNSNAPVAQVFRRVPLRVPAFAGADPLYAPAPPLPIDVAMAMLAANAQPAELAMANLVAKAETQRVVPIVKADSEKQICYGEVLNPLTIDSQNDWLTAADIEKAAHDYMMTSRVIGSEHGQPIRASVVESFVAPQDLDFVSPAGPVSVPKGTWLIGVKIKDADEWAKVKSGEYSGFSVGGFGVREPGMPDAMAA